MKKGSSSILVRKAKMLMDGMVSKVVTKNDIKWTEY
jgi:hypothetical protein